MGNLPDDSKEIGNHWEEQNILLFGYNITILADTIANIIFVVVINPKKVYKIAKEEWAR